MPTLPKLTLPALALVFASALAAAPAAEAQNLSRPGDAVDLQAAPDTFSPLAKRLMPAVVNITTKKTIGPAGGMPELGEDGPLEDFGDFFGRPEGFQQEGALGSGFVIDAAGFIVTNNHVVEGADEVNAVFSDGEVRRAEVIGLDEDTDLALLKVEAGEALPFVEFADSDYAEVGDWVIAIGNPFGFGGSVSAGIISAAGRDINSGRYDDYIQTDAAINRGNSGGPLFNLRGEVVGVNTAIISPTGGSVGIGFSIPSNFARSITDQLRQFGAARRARLGVNVQAADAALLRAYGVDGRAGVIVTRVEGGGPAEAAGVRVGDLILSFGGEPVDSVRALTRIVADAAVGEPSVLALVREGERLELEVSPDAREEAAEAEDELEVPDAFEADNALGAQLVELDDAARRRLSVPSDVLGVRVQSVSPRGPAFGVLRKDDVILEAGFETASSVKAVLDALEEAPGGEDAPFLLSVQRAGARRFVSVVLPEADSD